MEQPRKLEGYRQIVEYGLTGQIQCAALLGLFSRVIRMGLLFVSTT